MDKDYIPFGEEWKKEMAKFNKPELIELLRSNLIELQYLKTRDIVSMEIERMDWAIRTFPEATAISSLRKCEEEIKEIEADINKGESNPEEYADAIMCLFDSAGRQGLAPVEVIASFAYKIKKNKARRWQKNPDNTYSHIK